MTLLEFLLHPYFATAVFWIVLSCMACMIWVYLKAAMPRKFPCKDCGLDEDGELHRCNNLEKKK